MRDPWLAAVRKPEPGKVHLHTLPIGSTAIMWDDSEVRVESMNPSGVTVSEEITYEIAGKPVRTRKRYVVARNTNVRRKP